MAAGYAWVNGAWQRLTGSDLTIGPGSTQAAPGNHIHMTQPYVITYSAGWPVRPDGVGQVLWVGPTKPGTGMVAGDLFRVDGGTLMPLSMLTPANDISAPAQWATGSPHGAKKWCITSKGVIWRFNSTANGIDAYSSPDRGQTWTWRGIAVYGSSVYYASSFSVSIDGFDVIHLMYAWKAGVTNDGRHTASTMGYRRYVLTADTTAIVSDTMIGNLTGTDFWNFPDIVAFTMPDTGITWVHMVAGYNWAGDNRQVLAYWRYKYTTPTNGPSPTMVNESLGHIHDVTGGGTYNIRCAIEFRHNGDGKTPQLVAGKYQPDVFIQYTFQGDYRLYSVAYGNGTWEPRAIETNENVYYNLPAQTGVDMPLVEQHRWQSLCWDAVNNKIVVFGGLINSALSAAWCGVLERHIDAPKAQASWERRVMGPDPAFYNGCATIDRHGDYWMVACNSNNWGPPNSICNLYALEKTSATTINARLIGQVNPSTNEANPDMLRYPGDALLLQFTDGSASPFPIKMGRMLLPNVWRYDGTTWVRAGELEVWDGGVWKDTKFEYQLTGSPIGTRWNQAPVWETWANASPAKTWQNYVGGKMWLDVPPGQRWADVSPTMTWDNYQ